MISFKPPVRNSLREMDSLAKGATPNTNPPTSVIRTAEGGGSLFWRFSRAGKQSIRGATIGISLTDLQESDANPHVHAALDAGAGDDAVADRSVGIAKKDERILDQNRQVDPAPLHPLGPNGHEVDELAAKFEQVTPSARPKIHIVRNDPTLVHHSSPQCSKPSSR